MAEQSPVSIGDEVFIITNDGSARTGILSGSNANTTTAKLLYTIKLENSFWVGPASRVFPKGTTVEDAIELLRARETQQAQQALAQQAQREEAERHLAEAVVEEAKPAG
ncbi:hypothetical protein FJZ31_00080 [Candidatus Poribacteria bacterium]|nr:hypothetical protein [Candidatus Poribacteria bacterium]